MKMKIANVLKQLRKEKGFQPEYVVNELSKFGMEISAKTLYGYESGTRQPKADMFLYLCKIYNVNDFGIFFGQEHSEQSISNPTTDMFERLDAEDRAEIKGEMKQMLKSKKYTSIDEKLNDCIAEDLKNAIKSTSTVLSDKIL